MTMIQTKAVQIQQSLVQAGAVSPLLADLEQLLTDLFASLMACFPVATRATGPTPQQAQQALDAMSNPTRLQLWRMRRMTIQRVGFAAAGATLAAVQDMADQTTTAEVLTMTSEATPMNKTEHKRDQP